tara:strand:+ start:195 stop:530 length:336 start_codon:yes stop_codon:yes gene_type:complete
MAKPAMEPVAVFIGRKEPGLPTPELERRPALGELHGIEGFNRNRVADKESLQKINGIGDVDSAVVIDISSRVADQGTAMVKKIIEEILGIANLEAAVTVYISAKRSLLLRA